MQFKVRSRINRARPRGDGSERPPRFSARMPDFYSKGVAAAALILALTSAVSASSGGSHNIVNVSLSTPWNAQHPIYDILSVHPSPYLCGLPGPDSSTDRTSLYPESRLHCTRPRPSSLCSNPSRSCPPFLRSPPQPSSTRLSLSLTTSSAPKCSRHGTLDLQPRRLLPSSKPSSVCTLRR